MIKTFRGLLADGGQDRIRLQTIKGKVGYKIVKFEIMIEKLGHSDVEAVVQIFKEQQSSVPTGAATINFTDTSLLACAVYIGPASLNAHMTTTIFDNEVFNQDIYVTLTDNNDSNSCNYYIELEVVPLDDAGAEYTTLKDLRST